MISQVIDDFHDSNTGQEIVVAIMYSVSIGGNEMNGAESAYVVQEIQDYIEQNILENITLKQLSNVARYSPWYLSRIFKEVTGKTLYEYIRSRRLTMAALVLREGNKKVIDVALDFVFDSQEGSAYGI